MNLSATGTESQTENGLVVPGGRQEWDGLGVGDWQIQTITCKIDKQQGPIVQHRELYSKCYYKP